ncbi:Metallo-dependent phosphatase-like protein [Aspergillus ambiguus]|uniref:Metallo-dependent phosphatase-like protein n=1 Tax=Aspergillus ambiguus TaxID=176160 RepID=UPI003CCE45B2
MFEKVHLIFNKLSTSFQVLSDLHLEINQQYLSFEIPVCAKHLILAGDVGRLVDYDNYRDFLQKQTDRFELVFLVLGNHEFYNDTFVAGLRKARQLAQEPSLNGRLILLHQGRYNIPGSRVIILGCTLWSKVPNEAMDIADLTWLLSEIESIQSKNKTQNKKQSILVVTHYAPSHQGTSSPQHTNNPWSSAFATDIVSQISESSGVKVWVFGHTHYTTEFKNQGIRVVANQRGYVLPWNNSQGSKDRFNVGKVIHV